MRLFNSKTDNLWFVAPGLIALIAVVGIVTAVLLGHNAGNRIREQLSERSQSIAAALGPSQVTKLSGTPSDGDTPTYEQLKKQLADVKRANPDARSIYLMGRHDGRLFFYVDSEQPDSRDYSSAAEWYDDGTEADNHMFDTGLPVVEGPVTDSYGTFISGLAPIFQPGSKKVAAVIGIDVGASTYWRDIIVVSLIPLLTGFSFIWIIVVFEGIRRRNLRLLGVRSELVSLASHELHDPISGIRWAADNLLKLVTQERPFKLIKQIYDSASHLENSVSDMVQLSNAMDQRSPAIKPIDLTKLLREIVDAQNLYASRRGVSIEIDPSWPTELLVDCDAEQIKRVLQNLTSNALKFSPLNSTVHVSYKSEGKMHQVLITDHGIGIPASEQEKVLHGLYRASNATASNIPGSGVGLYLVKTVLESHGGSVSFTSEEGKGTTFVLSLPKQRK